MKPGDRFGRWVVLKLIPGWGRRGAKETPAKALCRCDCGTVQENTRGHLRAGGTKSCGCSLVTHGATLGGNPEALYRVWNAMKQRCLNPKAFAYHRYGGRGISVCDRWRHSFVDFRADMAPTYRPGLTIERIDNDGNYEPHNCKWATRLEQAQNTITKLLSSCDRESCPR